jgi:hypothetical protein
VNDARDNQCPGNGGFGTVDEISGDAGFHNEADRDEYSWPPQAGATLYETRRSSTPGFTGGCTGFTGPGPAWVDTGVPPVGGVYYYLVRPLQPNAGSWGQNSAGVERTGGCL